MPGFNRARVTGFLLENPTIINRDISGEEKVLFQIRVCYETLEGFDNSHFSNIYIYYDGMKENLDIKRFFDLKKFDLIQIEGVVNIMPMYKKITCEHCGEVMRKRVSLATIYPLHMMKLNGLQSVYDIDNRRPEQFLMQYYAEVSCEIFLMGTVVTDPEYRETERQKLCRYGIGIDRRYYIRTQPDTIADYPWIYSYGSQAESDRDHLARNAKIFVTAIARSDSVKQKVVCESCHSEIEFNNIATSFIPKKVHDIDYWNGYYTDMDLALMKELGVSK